MATQDVRGVRRSTSSAIGGVQAQFHSNEFDEQIVAQGMPPYAEMTRLGDGWATMATSAVAALVVRPSTVSGFEIYNGYAAGGKSLIIDRLFSQQLVTSTTGLGGGAQIWAMVTTAKAAPADGSFAIRGNSGKLYGGSVIAAAGTTVVANGWFPWGPTVKKESAGAVVPGGGLYVEVGGRLIVPPGASLCIQVVSGYVADTFCSGAGWYERVISNVA